ncbi:DNA-processing protein DprA [Bacillus marinisedimentorum]|uniref:DNA-processing protein DprA n=1 Tax=Bacillus marinisedimentorum TaxID=1821260 RepID=UPI0007DFEC2A|nr:DNA-processing protein DprA [Bacillus marinisedimentorum]
MTAANEKLIHIHHCSGGASWSAIRSMVEVDPGLTSVYNMSVHELMNVFQFNTGFARQFYDNLRKISIDGVLAVYNEEKITALTVFDSGYPSILKEIADPPWVLYGKGRTEYLQQRNWISVVGTRNPSADGRKAAEVICKALTNQGWGIISGLAAGIDAASHRAAISGNGATIAVLGSGFHHVYPRENLHLAEQISASHLLLSEYPPHIRPQKWQFPQRNRIISGLSPATVVVEAKERSGSLITADQALDQNREVFAVPGSIFEPCAAGTNRLIKEGAHPVINPDDIIDELVLFCE